MSVPMQDPVVPICFLYEHVDFGGKTLPITGNIQKFRPLGFNDTASSLIITKGEWVLYQHVNFGGLSITLQPGKYPNFVGKGINDMISSIKLNR